VPDSAIHITGNTVIDALMFAQAKVAAEPALAPVMAPLRERFRGKRIIAVTAHRRENFGEGMQQIARALKQLAARDDVAIIYPLHPNPNVVEVMRPALSGFINMAACDIVLTDSGGIQEEAPSLGKPVLVMRDTTERPEGVAAGTARLVGADAARIIAETGRLLDDRQAYESMGRAHNPYGDGTASRRIAAILAGA
jgi:UDP-N-acetylglucosamine 2-epimerase (non-hydrolysing)